MKSHHADVKRSILYRNVRTCTRAVGARCYKWANEIALTVLRSNAFVAGCRQKEGSIQQRYLPLSLSLPFLLLYPQPTRVYRKYAPTTFAHTHTRRKENITVREMIPTQVPRRHLPVLHAEAVGSSLMSYGNGRSFPPLCFVLFFLILITSLFTNETRDYLCGFLG